MLFYFRFGTDMLVCDESSSFAFISTPTHIQMPRGDAYRGFSDTISELGNKPKKWVPKYILKLK